ncbi:MAG: transglutaminase domain-containing protein [Methanobrevibacter sp.]|nr:transglutaminase domain-containing protein [Methanobrevibacter sp.]
MLLVLTLVFFISLSANYACNVSDNTLNDNYNLTEELSKNSDSSLNNETNKTSQKYSVNLNDSKISFLAAGGEERPTKLSQDSIINASKNVNNFISKNGKLPNHVTINDYKFSMPEFMFLLSKTIQNKYKKTNSDVTIKYDVNNPTKPSGAAVKGTISSKNYYNYTARVVSFINKNNIAPNFVRTSLGVMQYQATIHSFVKILGGMKDNKLPSSISLNIKKTSSINNHLPKYIRPDNPSSKALNDLYVNGSLEEYLKATKNCQVEDELIQSLASEITKNSKSKLQKATAIFNWVRNNVVYQYYYNTKHGAKNTYNKRVGNCVDQSHLVIALSRASGIPARYVHGRCKFLTGKTIGHVWAQILVNNMWTVADPTSSKNSFGVINSWTTYTIHGKFDKIDF